MSKKKKHKKIKGRFIPLSHNLVDSEAYKQLSATATRALIYFKRDVKNGHQTEVVLTFGQAQKYGVCDSSTTFCKVKKELVKHGLLDPVDGGGLNAPAVFKLSERWRQFNTGQFNEVPYKLGVGSKYFRTAMKDETKRKRLLDARHPNHEQSPPSSYP